jgi:hypothetical protein
MIEFVFMLTHQDATVPHAAEVLDSVRSLARNAGLRYIGFKDVGAGPERQRELADAAHEAGLQVMLEVVSTSAEAELASLRAAVAAGVDWVLGGTHVDEGERLLAGSPVRYCPFPGRVVGHPSVLEGGIDEIAADAAAMTARPGVYGLDLLAYRHRTVDPVALTRTVVKAAAGPVVAAGSVISREQIEALADAGAWGFTIGGAIFEGRLPGGPDVAAQVRAVLEIANAS